MQTPTLLSLASFQSLLLWDSMISSTSPSSVAFLYSFLNILLICLPQIFLLCFNILQHISSTQSSIVPINENKTIFWFNLYILSKFVMSDPWFMSIRGSNKSSKTIGPPGNPKGNTVHMLYCAISPEIVSMGG
jgi:hypothetical protein